MSGGIDAPEAALEAIDDAELIELARSFFARGGQVPPPGDWSQWLLLAGRGFGKTRTGATWVDTLATGHAGARFGLVGATAADARAVMVEGEAGVVAVNPGVRFEPSRRRLEWPNGSSAALFSAEEPDSLRGPSFHYAWGDEAARWGAAGPAVLANLRLALRLGDTPRLLLTTTPLPLAWLKALAADAGVRVTRGRTADNRHLSAAFVDAMTRDYGGTRLGRQELDGEFIDQVEGALWTRELLETCRIGETPPLFRVVVGVDPPAGVGSHVDACGIVVAGLDAGGGAVVVADRSVQGLDPAGWARAVIAAADDHDADLVIAEVNNGGAMVTSMLRGVAPMLNVRGVHAAAGKVARAEPVAALYARGRIRHAGTFPALEDELCALGAAGRWVGPGRSPDRADALVWALTELLLARPVRAPGVRVL